MEREDSPQTVSLYRSVMRSFTSYLAKTGLPLHLSSFQLDTCRGYLVYLQDEHVKNDGHHFKRAGGRLASVTIQGHARTLKSFASWLHREGYSDENILERLRSPRPRESEIVPLTDEEITRVLRSFDPGTMAGCRGLAIVSVLLDTGVRAGELCGIRPRDIDTDTGEVRVLGKGDKERTVAIGHRCRRTVLRYMHGFMAEPAMPTDDHLFLTFRGRPTSRNSLQHLFCRIGERAGIHRIHPHLCLHTFAVKYLKNGGDVFTVQRILGHTTLKMVNHYLHLSQADIVAKHRLYSPLDSVHI